jgi:alpha-L-fucosidase
MKYLLFLLLLPIITLAQKAPKPYGPLPTKGQLQWQETAMYCIIHFGPTTYMNKEWGYGDEGAAVVNPTEFSAMQIVGAAKAGVLKGL